MKNTNRLKEKEEYMYIIYICSLLSLLAPYEKLHAIKKKKKNEKKIIQILKHQCDEAKKLYHR